jgi:hypothetical protein
VRQTPDLDQLRADLCVTIRSSAGRTGPARTHHDARAIAATLVTLSSGWDDRCIDTTPRRCRACAISPRAASRRASQQRVTRLEAKRNAEALQRFSVRTESRWRSLICDPGFLAAIVKSWHGWLMTRLKRAKR